jgi:hypothetical protein
MAWLESLDLILYWIGLLHLGERGGLDDAWSFTTRWASLL